MLGWVQGLWNRPAREQVEIIERQEPTFEERLERILAAGQGLRNRSDAEIAELIQHLNAVLDIVETAIVLLDATEVDQRFRNLRRRLRHTQTRAQKAAAA